MSKWINCLLQYCKDGKVGACPVCGSANVQIQKHGNGNRGSLTLLCENCKATDHFDGFLDPNVNVGKRTLQKTFQEE